VRAAPGTEVVHDPGTYVEGAPLDVLDRLREQDPGVAWVEEPPAPGYDGGPGYWLVLRHADVKAVLRDADTFSSYLGATQVRDPAGEQDLAYVRQMMLNMDDPDHSRLRRPVQRSLTMRAVARLEEQIRGHVRDILDRALTSPGQVLDFAEDVAADLPLLTLADVLGVPAQDRMLLFDWSNRVIGFQDPDYASSAVFDAASGTEMARAALAVRPGPDDAGRMPDPRSRSGMPDLYAYAHHLARYRQQHPGDDVMSTVLAQGEAVGVEEFENMFWLFAVAGNETLRNGLPGGMHALLRHPEAQRRLRAEPGLVEPAVEEMLRWWTPVMVFRRTATRDCEVGGRPVARGRKVVVSFLSANRDPRVFDDPGSFRVDRNSRAHLAFGHGPHLCVGAHLARVQMRSMLAELLRRTTWLEAAGEPALLRSSFQRGVKQLPMSWR
jgi:cytochrome P450